MTISNDSQVRECAILLAYARQIKATAEGDLTYWTAHSDAAKVRARSEIGRAREAISACGVAMSEVERSRDAALAGLDVADSLKSARRTLDALAHYHVRLPSSAPAKRKVRAFSGTFNSADEHWPA